MRAILTLILILSILPAAGQGLEEDFARLDRTIELAEDYAATHESRISALWELLENHQDLKEVYNLYDRLYNEEYTYNFDRALTALNLKEETAHKLKDRSAISETNIQKATLYCIAGMYLESLQVASQIDTSCLNRDQMIEYFYFQQRFNSDFSEYTSSGEDRKSMQEAVHYYRNRIIKESVSNDNRRTLMEMREMLDGGRLEEADSLGLSVLSLLDPASHEYAEFSYWEGTVCRDLGRWEDMMSWFAKSAVGDIKSSTKDNASLQTIAIELLKANKDIERAFKYTQLSLNDAIFFNARLRPWQIAQNLPAIEKAYNSARAVNEKRARFLFIELCILTLILFCALVLLLIVFSRQKRIQKKMEEVNNQLQAAMADLSIANAAKEEYIGLFLTMCSSYINKLKKFLSRDQIDEELKNFYKAFDNAFLQLYPDFVDKFNALLVPEARIELKKDELLNTELRIFAVIKLGITQSSHIAALLRYSVNTIYNYRAQIKNAALNGKESFEDMVKAI